MSSTTSEKIKAAISEVIPQDHSYRIYTLETGIDEKEVLRVVTSAWGDLEKAERIEKIQNAVFPRLEKAERRKIFRFSVLTPVEWENLRSHMVNEKSKVLGFRRVAMSMVGSHT